jgi:hypothetical protein
LRVSKADYEFIKEAAEPVNLTLSISELIEQEEARKRSSKRRRK